MDTTKSDEEQRDNLIEIIQGIVDQFKFPDGCLDLSGDDLDDFIITLAGIIQEEYSKNMERSDCIKCIRDPIKQKESEIKSLCGKNIVYDFHFISIDHAFLNIRNEDRLSPCPECTKIVLNMFILGMLNNHETEQ